jgi:hypothetical protein
MNGSEPMGTPMVGPHYPLYPLYPRRVDPFWSHFSTLASRRVLRSRDHTLFRRLPAPLLRNVQAHIIPKRSSPLTVGDFSLVI